jgi:2-dehydropantoate 2-reductase
MEIALIGAGAIGAIVGAYIANSTQHLYIVENWEETFKGIKENGLRVIGEVKTPLTVINNYTLLKSIEELPLTIDLVILVTKLDVAPDVVKQLQSHLTNKFTLMTLTNGMLEEDLIKFFDPTRILSCVISFAAKRLGPGYSDKTSIGEIVMGRLEGPKQKMDDEVLRIFSNIEPTSWSEDMLSHKYSKLIINSAITSLMVITGAKLGEIFKQELAKVMFLTILTESVQVAKAHDIKLKKLNGLSFDFLSLTEKQVHGFSLKFLIKKAILGFIGKKYKRLYASSLYSLSIGRKTEIDYLNGYISQKGKEAGVKTPMHDKILEVVHRIENKEIAPSIDNYKLIIERTKEIWDLE